MRISVSPSKGGFEQVQANFLRKGPDHNIFGLADHAVIPIVTTQLALVA